MEYPKITNVLGNTPNKVPRIITRNWIELHDQSGYSNSIKNQIRFKTPLLRSDLCD